MRSPTLLVLTALLFGGQVNLADQLRAQSPRMNQVEVPGMAGVRLTVHRLGGNPIVPPNPGGGIGSNVQGPSLIRVPSWVKDPLGRYYLYFADHKGSYIRLAYADQLTGPWSIYEPGTLQLDQSHFLTQRAQVPKEVRREVELGGWATAPVEGVPDPLDSATKPHIASPDVHVREDLRQIIMYYHGLEDFRFQRTRVAMSGDGIHFVAREELLGYSYLRAFPYEDRWYAMAMPGVFYRSQNGLGDFEQGPTLFPTTMRHAALLKHEDRLFVFWTRVGDAPEHILLSTVHLTDDWLTWRPSEAVSVVRPQERYEGSDLPVVASVRDAINVRVNQLRDPAIFTEGTRTYLLYACAGESGIAIAELTFD